MPVALMLLLPGRCDTLDDEGLAEEAGAEGRSEGEGDGSTALADAVLARNFL
jgi:hypothetical protein